MRFIGCLIASTLLFSYCGGKKSDTPGNISPNKSFGLVSNDTLQGYWISDCHQPGSGLFGLHHVREQIQFKDQGFAATVVAFNTTDCSPQSATKLLMVGGTFAIGGTAAAGAGSNLDLGIKTGQLVALTPESAAVMNTNAGTCGFTDWSAGVVREITDIAGCDYLYTAAIKPYTIAMIAEDQLVLGDYYSTEQIGTSADQRPTTYAGTDTFQKNSNPLIGDRDDSASPTPVPTPAPTPIPTPTPTLTFDELKGSWSGAGTLTRGSREYPAGQVRFTFNRSETAFSVSYGICQNPTSCSGGDLYGRKSGAIRNNRLYLTCKTGGVSKEYEAGGIVDGVFELALPTAFDDCSNHHKIHVQKSDEGDIVLIAQDDNYGEAINGVAIISK